MNLIQLSIQLFGALAGMVAIYFSHLHYKRGHFTARELYFWVLVWLIFIFVVAFPEAARLVTSDLGLSRSSDLGIIAFVILFSITFYNYISNRRQKNKLNRLVQELALKEFRGGTEK